MVLKLGQPCCCSVRRLHDIGRGTCPVVARMCGESVNLLGSCCPRIHHNNDKHAFLDLHATQRDTSKGEHKMVQNFDGSAKNMS